MKTTVNNVECQTKGFFPKQARGPRDHGDSSGDYHNCAERQPDRRTSFQISSARYAHSTSLD